MEAQGDGGHEICVKSQSLVANDDLPDVVQNRNPSVVLPVKLVEGVGEFNCRDAEGVVPGLQVGGVNHKISHQEGLVRLVDVAEDERQHAEVGVGARPRGVEPQHIESHHEDEDGVEQELEEGEEGADLRVQHEPHGVYVVDSGEKAQVRVVSADRRVEAPVLQSLHEQAHRGGGPGDQQGNVPIRDVAGVPVGVAESAVPSRKRAVGQESCPFRIGVGIQGRG